VLVLLLSVPVYAQGLGTHDWQMKIGRFVDRMYAKGGFTHISTEHGTVLFGAHDALAKVVLQGDRIVETGVCFGGRANIDSVRWAMVGNFLALQFQKGNTSALQLSDWVLIDKMKRLEQTVVDSIKTNGFAHFTYNDITVTGGVLKEHGMIFINFSP